MTKFIILLFFITYTTVSNAQLRPLKISPKPPTLKQQKQDEINHNCIHRDIYTSAQRLQFYPFNKASEIRVVSFDNKSDTNRFVVNNGTLPIKNKSVDYSQLDEVKTLNPGEVQNLSNIIYNVVYKGYFFTFSEAGCYNPRNAILFVDAKGKTFAFIDLCFECRGHRTSSRK